MATSRVEHGRTAAAPAAAPLGSTVSDYLAVVSARAAVIVFGLAFVVVATHMLGPAGYGVFAFILLAATLLMTVSSSWLTTAVFRYGREEVERHGTMSAVTWSRALVAAPVFLLGAIAVTGLAYLDVLPGRLSGGAALVAAVLGLGLALQEHQISALQSVGRAKLSALAMAGQQAFALAALGGVAAAGLSRTAVAVGSVLAAATVASSVALVPWLWRRTIWPIIIPRAVLRRVVTLSVPMVAFTFSQLVMRWVDLVIIGIFASTTAVGIYAVAYQAYGALQTLVGAVTPVLIPVFVSLRLRGGESLIGRYFESAVPQLTFIGGVLCALAVPLSDLLFPAFFGERFADAALPLEILLVALPLFAFASLLAPVLVLHEETRVVGRANALAALVNIVADLMLIGLLDLDLTGGAIATCLSALIIAVGYLAASRRRLAAAHGIGAAPFGAPLIALAAVVTMPGAGGQVVALGAVLVYVAVVVNRVRPFPPMDAELVTALERSGGLGAASTRLVALVSR